MKFFMSSENFRWPIAIYFCLSLYVNNLFTCICLLLWNHWSEFDETWSQWSSSCGDENSYLERVWPPGGWGRGQMGSNSVKSSNEFSSETTGQILMKLGHNDHLMVGIIIYTWKWSDPPGELRGGAKWGQIVQNLLTTSPPKPLVRF